jgi:hypothetical protein
MLIIARFPTRRYPSFALCRSRPEVTYTATQAAMPILVLIPMILCTVALFRDSAQKAFLNVYIPVFMLFPIYYYWKVAALPPIDMSEAALLPLGVAMVLTELRRWKLSWMDALMAVFIFSAWASNAFKGQSTAAIFGLFDALCLAGIPYMAGKLLIEPNGGRTALIKRSVFLLFVASLLSSYEYRMGQNPFTLVFGRFFPGELFAWKTQIRWGFGRVSGPFGQSELAGMVLFAGLVLALYLALNHEWEPKFSKAPWLPFRKSSIILGTLGITLLMTQARGPWIGCLLAIPIAIIGRARNVARAALLFGTLCLVVGPIAMVSFQHYTSSAEQQTAQYRAHLMDNYLPVAEQGGLWGWGAQFPRVDGQGSIDNQYLFLALTQGWAGLTAFVLLAAGALYHLIQAAGRSEVLRDRYFAYSLLGIMIGLLITIYTVFLGNQPYELFFLLLGWSQAIRTQPAEAPRFAFEHVYT